ncbi:ATPase, T2SS/T4P/T4SS family [Vibrio sp. 10N.261.46.E12]|uniref:GspE/PulE family protein n=1 Tax=unclassified Vibrio TaxID=2614977 RepID=UPI000C819E96|nr:MULTISPECIES: ATPase, T2SS/T4P/T4SS family [unclassified Vibrio]PML89288.1 exonuclease SbcC [Vibrio sp. 10N.261.49.E11]PMN80288.1 exonuclease SbcC [Vibrio sp. 10N.261.45.A6]PMN82194.1 exonuclease SbcC [Vibrio sp. 10N.261.45.A1]
MNAEQILQTDTLKTLYFTSQDTVLMTDGTLQTCDFDSPAIESIKQLVKANPEQFGFDFEPDLLVRFSPRSQVAQWLNDISREVPAAPSASLLQQSETATRAKRVLEQAVLKGSSDIHIELFKHQTRIEVRVDGRMIELMKPIGEYEYGELLIGYLFNELCEDKDDDFHVGTINNGRMSLLLDTPKGKRETQWRLAYIPAKDKGGQCTLRWSNKETSIPTLDNIGWEAGHVNVMRDFMNSASGICLIAGQTSSGKTTTIAAALSEMKRQGRSINTVEDPVEFDLGVIQTSVTAKQGQDNHFNAYTKALLRHDVDIESHGEVRDEVGAMDVCRKGETGQIMFSTLHTSSAVGIAHTLNEQMHVPSALLAAPDLMKLWIYQTLVRTVCPHCALSLEQAEETWTEQQKTHFAVWQASMASLNPKVLRFRNPEGCSQCVEGEKGRTTLIEMVVLDDDDRALILSRDYLAWLKALKVKGFKSVVDHANLKILRGEVDIFSAAGRVDGLFPKDTNAVYQGLWEEVKDERST